MKTKYLLIPILFLSSNFSASAMDSISKNSSINRSESVYGKFEFNLEARHTLMNAYFEQKTWNKLQALVEDTLKVTPKDPVSENLKKAGLEASAAEISAAEEKVKTNNTPENQLELSFAHYRAGRFVDCISASKEALKLKPDYAEAYNNIGSAYAALGKWSDAVKADEEALRIRPDYPLAKNNLKHAKSFGKK